MAGTNTLRQSRRVRLPTFLLHLGHSVSHRALPQCPVQPVRATRGRSWAGMRTGGPLTSGAWWRREPVGNSSQPSTSGAKARPSKARINGLRPPARAPTLTPCTWSIEDDKCSPGKQESSAIDLVARCCAFVVIGGPCGSVVDELPIIGRCPQRQAKHTEGIAVAELAAVHRA